jgi:Tol biopolymer transport system component
VKSILMTLCLTFSCLCVRAAKFDLGQLSKLVNVSDPQISADGKSIAIVVSRPDYELDLYRSELVLVDIDTHKQRVLTRDRKGVAYPRWSPSGDRLSFLAHDANDKPQIFVMPMTGGDAEQLTKATTGVQQYRWRPDSEAIAYAVTDEAPKKTGPEKFEDAFEVGNNSFLTNAQPLPTHLWLVGSSDGEAKRLASGSWSLPVAQIPFGHDAPFTWSPDGKSIVLVKLATPYSGDANHSTLQVLDVASGNLQPVTGRPKYESNPYLSPDGNRLAYLFPHEGKWQNGADVYVLAGNHGEGTNISSQIDRDMVRLAWMPDNKSLLVGANDHTTVGLCVLPLDGKAVRLDLGNVCPSWPGWWVDLSIGLRGDIAFAGSEPQHPMELYYLANTTAKPSRLTDFNTDRISRVRQNRNDRMD